MTLITDIETVKVVRFECDGYKCDEQSGAWDAWKGEDEPVASDYPDMIQLLKDSGWTFTGGKCYCPECSEHRRSLLTTLGGVGGIARHF